ncbi:MAG: NADH-ubiquinone oxidoreductase-F iron-sulfur binding region domain-containing protein [Aeromicrobium sp.]
MTTLLEAPTTPVSAIGAPRLLSGVVDPGVVGQGRVDHARHLALHGSPVLRRLSWLVSATHDVSLLGRGGGAFPVSAKLDAMPTGARVAVLLNGSEGEPASRKDRTLMTYAPHLVIDGALVVADALDTRDVTIAVHDAVAHDSLVRACSERTDASDVRVIRTDDGFVGGEIRAVIHRVDGDPAVPDGRRVLPHVRGIGQRPTFASNVETFAQLALLSRLGVAEFARTGSPNEPGTSLLTLIGDTSRPGVVEVPNGTPLSSLLPSSSAPVLIGGYHGAWRPSADGVVVERASLRAAGSPLGAGVIARPHPGTCVVDEVVRVAAWLASESAGQCGPCYFGLPALADDLAALAAGAGPERTASALRRLGLVRGRGACSHPDGSAMFIGTALDTLGPELEVHRRHGRCGLPPSTVLPLPTVGAR